jgi:hypothetical protein
MKERNKLGFLQVYILVGPENSVLGPMSLVEKVIVDWAICLLKEVQKMNYLI